MSFCNYPIHNMDQPHNLFEMYVHLIFVYNLENDKYLNCALSLFQVILLKIFYDFIWLFYMHFSRLKTSFFHLEHLEEIETSLNLNLTISLFLIHSASITLLIFIIKYQKI